MTTARWPVGTGPVGWLCRRTQAPSPSLELAGRGRDREGSAERAVHLKGDEQLAAEHPAPRAL